MAIWYLDTSAVAKLVRPESETPALRRWLGGKRWIISDLQRTQLRRAAQLAVGVALARAERLLAESDVLSINAATFDTAGRMQPAALRSLEAVHLAAAANLGSDLGGIVAYDDRLLRAATEVGIRTSSPGA